MLGAHYAALAVLSGAVPILGAAVYALVRPEPASLRRERELFRRLTEEELYGGERCLECRAPVEPDWLRCPTCCERLHDRCECGAILELYWNVCPWCARELGGLERLAEPEHVAVGVADTDLEHSPGALDRVVEDLRAAAA